MRGWQQVPWAWPRMQMAGAEQGLEGWAHLVQDDEVAAQAPAPRDEVAKAQRQRERHAPPLAAAQLPDQARMQTRSPGASIMR